MAKKKNGRDLYIYLRSRLGYAAAPNTSVFVLLCEALAKDGRPLPDETDIRAWVAQNTRYIKDVVKNIKESFPATVVADKPPVLFFKNKNLNVLKKVSKKKKQSKLLESNVVASSDFLHTYEWRKLRMEALKLHGAKCQCCGATPATGAVMNVDHIKPRKLFPELALSLENLQVLCGDCNHGKGNWDQTDWRCTK